MAPKVSDSTFTATMWGGVAVSACFVLLRIFSRFETSRKIFTDDILRAMFLQQASNEQEYLPHLPYAIATGILFLTGLWTIKLSFLLLARALVQRVSGPKRLWRWLTGITVASGVLCLVIPWWICLPGKDGKPNEKCPGSATDLRRIALLVGTSLDVVTDALVLVIPSSLLWKAQRNWRRKLAPGGVLFFILFVIAFAIVRATVATVSQAHADEIQLYLWSNLEFAMAITAACISPFRKLIKRWDRGPAQARPVVDRITTYLRSTLDRMRKRNKTASNFSDGIGLVDIEPSTGRSFASLGSSFTDPNVPLG